MALSTQVILLSIFILADSYLFALDLFDGRDHRRIPLGLPDPFNLFPDMFDPTPPSIIHRDPFRERHKPLFTSDFTTARSIPREDFHRISTNEAPVPPTQEKEEDTSVQDPEIDREVFLMKNAKVPEEITSTEENLNSPEPNSLSIHEDSQESVNLPENTEVPVPIENTISDIMAEFDRQIKDGNVPELTKNSDFLLIPVTAVNPITSNSDPDTNSFTAAANNGNIVNSGGGVSSIPPSFTNLGNNINGVPYSQPYGNNNQPNLANNGAPNTVYTIVSIPNNLQPNNFYTQPNNSPSYNILVPMNNQPNTYAIVNSNQPYNFVPVNNQPNSYLSVNNQPNSFVPLNNPSNNFIPVINQPNGFVPVNNQPNNFVPVNNQPNNYVTSQPNFFAVSNQPNNFVPYNNQPINVIPINNVPNNNLPLNNQPGNNFVPVNNVPNNNFITPPSNNIFTPNNQPNYVPSVSSIVPSNNQPGNIATFTNNVPNNNGPLPVLGIVNNTRDQDEDDTENVEIKNERDGE